ncbi:MAG: formyltransferase family protein [Desulforhopalus sp.]|jgi:phosphoribosylglycinamide formyltransferase-1|nr:formyltransferase family protein [Desulforhopalus sp.]
MLRLGVLLSGSGRTLDNFHERINLGTLDARIEVVISNVEGALGLKKAVHYGYPAYYAVDNQQINNILADYQIDIVCLAGFLKLYLPPPELSRAVINIHPALIPSFCGEGYFGNRVHRAVKARGCTVSGCTVHFADDCYDQGPIILQRAVELDYDDDLAAIAAKVFAAECEAFPEAINRVGERGIDFFWERVGR